MGSLKTECLGEISALSEASLTGRRGAPPVAPAKLVLASGEVFPGFAPAWQTGFAFGEVVFTTGMTGYVESLTDPSYAGQILTFTYPLIGNYGTPPRTRWESGKIQPSGVVVATASACTSHWEAERSFLDWLRDEKIPLIAGVDTRALTKLLRQKGAALGAICDAAEIPGSFADPNRLNLVSQVSTPQRILHGKGAKKVIAVDCGMKANILRSFLRYPIEVHQVPFDYDYSGEEFDGLFLSNGPGDPKMCVKTIAILRKALALAKPVFGICLGAQLLALAIGAATYKLRFGHRGQNHPCLDLEKQQAILTSQNHGYAIDESSLPQDWRVTYRSLNDGSVEGIAHKTRPFFAVQFHPEHHPGPTDAESLFDRFYEVL